MEIITPDRIKILLPYISACDLLIVGAEDLAAGLRYDDENMFAPIIILLEEGLPLAALKKAAAEKSVPVQENDALARNLFAYGKLSEVIPELCCREIAALMMRTKKRPRVSAKQKKGKLPGKRFIRVELGETLMSFLGDISILEEGFRNTQKRLSRLFGFSFPPIGIRVNPRLKSGEYRILFKAIEAGRFSLDLRWFKCVDLGLSNGQIRSAANAAAQALVAQVDELVQKRAPELLGRDEVQAILDAAEKKYPVVTGEVKSLLSLGSIRDIFRGLLGEHVSIRCMPVILETLADWGSFGPAPNELIIEQIRQSLKRQICLDYADDKQTLKVLTLETKLEENFSDRAMFHSLNASAPSDEWLEAFSPAIRGMEEKGLKPVILCSPIARSWIKEFTRMKFPNLAVLSYVEIPPEIKVEPIGEIAVKGLGS